MNQITKALYSQKLLIPFTVFLYCSNYLKKFANSQPSTFFLTVGQNNFGNKIPFFISGMHTNDRLNVRTREGKVIVNISEKNPNQVLYVADSIESVIKPHQIGGVRFLYDNIIESPSVYQSSPGKI